VHLHILFFVQNWNVNVLLINTQADKFSQLAYDMFVSFSTQSYAVIISPSPAPFFGPSSLLGKVGLSSCIICARMVARYAPPISYNFLNLINLDSKETIFEKVTFLLSSLFIFSPSCKSK